jgi:uncharacterized membrane protein YkoI
MDISRVLLTIVFLIVWVYPPDLGRASEKDVVELEDVSDAEKIRWARATKVSVSDAIRTAILRTPGQVIEAALHSIRGRLLYEIEVVTSDDRVVELYVDPQSGRLVDSGEKR